MHRLVLLHVFLLVLLFTLSESWFFRGSRRSYRPVTPASTKDPKSTKIWESAKSKIGWTKWSKEGTWYGTLAGYWKCNLFVYDILKEATESGGLKILANDWADRNSKSVKSTGHYELVETKNAKKGNIIAFKRNGQSGHVGIVSTNGKFISALKTNVGVLDIKGYIKKKENHIVDTTVWRYIGP